MSKSILFRKASVIHAVKCHKTTNPDVALKSSEKLKEIMVMIDEAVEDNYDKINETMENWQNENPVVSEGDIKEIF